jgi:predicted outer membrane repeat protein
MKVRTCLFSSLFSAALFASPGISQTVWYVDDDATSGGNGLSWASAHQDLQTTLDLVGTGDQIWVAVGRYRPTLPVTPGDARSATFKIPIEVRIYGGFVGNETSVSGRAGLFDRTELSGDLGVKGVATDNAYHVVYLGENSLGNYPSRIDGFTISRGNANGTSDLREQRGGGIYVSMDGLGYSPVLELANCTIRDNRGFRGSGIAIDNLGLVNMRDCRLTRNSAVDQGGALLVQTGILRAHNCQFDRNRARKGGVVYLNSTSIDHPVTGPQVRFVNSLFHDNVASRGGVAFLEGNSLTRGIGTWVNCTLDNNSASTSGGAFFAKTGALIPALLTVRNSILWNKQAPIHPQIFGSNAEVSYSDIRGIWPGLGNFMADPQFVDRGARDYHTLAGSPAHDAGDNTAMFYDIVDLDGDGDFFEPVPIDFDGNPRFADDPAANDTGVGTPPLIDVGAYEF